MFSDSFNWALYRPTWQSSTYSSSSAEKAVDGILTANLWQSCAITEAGSLSALSWWAVDLSQNIKVSRVVISGRSDAWCKYVYSSLQLMGFFLQFSTVNLKQPRNEREGKYWPLVV